MFNILYETEKAPCTVSGYSFFCKHNSGYAIRVQYTKKRHFRGKEAEAKGHVSRTGVDNLTILSPIS